MPVIGLGTWNLMGREGVFAMEQAIDIGYRMIDTAIMYCNEKEVGQAIRNSGVDRSEMFVTDKINRQYASYEKTKKAGAFIETLNKSQLEELRIPQNWQKYSELDYIYDMRGLF
jgi:diketogulonate reductase-like aldo/keto reductase